MADDDKTRENRIRRMAARQELQLQRSPRRDPNAAGYGRYRLIDPMNNTVVYGSFPRDFSCTLDEIEAWLLQPDEPTEKVKA